MATKPLKISTQIVSIGMYITELDRPWQNTPFAVHGFYVRDLDEVKRLKAHCEHVYIDPVKGIVPTAEQLASVKPVVPEVKFQGKLIPITVNASVYETIEPIEQELVRAQLVYDELLDELMLVMTQLAKGKLHNVDSLLALAHSMVDSLVRNPDAFIWFVRVCKAGNHPYYYLLRTACWSVLFGRHLGLAKTDLRALAVSQLLKDIGKLCLPSPSTPQINTQAENQENINADPVLAEQILESSLSLLRTFDGIHPKVIKIIKMHNERLNGSGFPNQLTGDQIFLLAKIAGIASYYDAVTYLPQAKCATPVSKSVSRLYEVRGSQFQDDIVIEFIQAIGLYPTGTLVKLSNNEIAVVAEQTYQRRLKPKVLIAVDTNGQALEQLKMVDLFKDSSNLDIVEDIEPYKYPIKVTKIRLSRLSLGEKKSLFKSLFKKK